jgi:hypothetical protein
MLISNAHKRFKAALVENRRDLIWLFLTYIPAVFIAGYGGYWLLGNYVLAFIVGGAYMVWFMVVLARIFSATLGR